MPGQLMKRSLQERTSSASTPKRFGDLSPKQQQQKKTIDNDREHIHLVTYEDSGVSPNERLHG